MRNGGRKSRESQTKVTSIIECNNRLISNAHLELSQIVKDCCHLPTVF